MLQGENLTLTYQDGDATVDAVHGISVAIEDHQFIGILGPSGSGKSSPLYLLSGLRKPSGGEVYLDARAYGGMSDKERVVIARAMIHRPRVIFADEPTGSSLCAMGKSQT